MDRAAELQLARQADDRAHQPEALADRDHFAPVSVADREAAASSASVRSVAIAASSPIARFSGSIPLAFTWTQIATISRMSCGSS
jgi:hypothetical protein